VFEYNGTNAALYDAMFNVHEEAALYMWVFKYDGTLIIKSEAVLNILEYSILCVYGIT
jgi:hypothetical protein